MKKRIEYIDILKGFAISLMVFSHIAEHIFVNTNLLIYSFHMPLFFIISGFCFKQKDEKEYIIKKAKSLLIPYIVIYALSAIILSIKSGFKPDFLYLFLLPTKIKHSGFQCGAIWFLPALFIASVLMNFLVSKIKKKFLFIPFTVIAIGAFLIPKIKIKTLDFSHAPLAITCGLMGFVFMMIGYFIKNHNSLVEIKWYYLIPLGIVNYFVIQKNVQISLYSCTYGKPYLFLIETILGSIIILNIFKLLYENVLGKSSHSYIKNALCLKFIGNNSLYFVLFSQSVTYFLSFAIKNYQKNNLLLFLVYFLTMIITSFISICIAKVKELIKNRDKFEFHFKLKKKLKIKKKVSLNT